MQKTTKRNSVTRRQAEAELRTFIDKFDPSNQKLIRATRTALRAKFPNATEIVYDNYNFFVIGYSPTERPSHAVVSIAAAANGVSICFVNGARLPDPSTLLVGAGKQTRFLRIDSPAVLRRPAVNALFKAAAADAAVPFDKTAKPGLIIKSISRKQRPRRRPT